MEELAIDVVFADELDVYSDPDEEVTQRYRLEDLLGTAEAAE